MAWITVKNGPDFLPQHLEVSDQPLHWGGQARLFLTADGQYVVKIYHAPSPGQERALEALVALGRRWTWQDQPLMWAWAWPVALVAELDGQPCLGVAMRRAPGSYVQLVRLIASPATAVEQFRRGRTWSDFLRMARAIAEAVSEVHSVGLYIGALSSWEFLADPDSGEVVLLNCDDLGVTGFWQPAAYGTPGYMAPELVMRTAEPSEKSDRHSLAVLLLWTLLFRNVMQPPLTASYAEDPDEDDRLGWGRYACFSENPHDRRHWFERIGQSLFKGGALSYRCLTPRLQELTERALIEGLHAPEKRPTAREWAGVLAEAYHALATCRTCSQSLIYPFWIQPASERRCPFCGEPVQAPGPAVVELLEARTEKLYAPVHPLVLEDGTPLFADVVERGQLSPFARHGQPVVGQVEWDAQEGTHRLTNRSDLSWQVLAGGAGVVKPGESITLRPGTILQLGEGKRLLHVLE